MLRRYLLILLLLFVSPVQAETIAWAVADGPPFHLPGSVPKPARPVELGEGVNDLLIAYLAEELPGFHHRLEHLSRPKMWRLMQAGEPICYVDAFKTPERLGFAYFSAVTVGVPQVLATRAGTPGLEGEQVLKELLQRKDLRGVFEMGRSYGAHLDPMLEAAKVSRQPLPSSPQVLRMLEAGRMDYLVEYPMALQYYVERLSPAPELAFFDLFEERDPPPAYVACTRSAWGKGVIEAVDGAIRRLAVRPESRRAFLRWLPADVRQAHGARIERFYRERALQRDAE
ncbi:MAG: hypothetical protein U1E77_11410 [Inhella sp.]